MNKQKFESLKAGDVIEAKSLFPKLTDEATLIEVRSVYEGRVHCVASFMGVSLGSFLGELIDGRVKWSAP